MHEFLGLIFLEFSPASGNKFGYHVGSQQGGGVCFRGDLAELDRRLLVLRCYRPRSHVLARSRRIGRRSRRRVPHIAENRYSKTVLSDELIFSYCLPTAE